MKSIQVEREILRYENGQIKHIEDSIVTEFPVTVKINGQEFVTMVSTPEYIEDMVIGFLASEGIIRKYEDINEIWVQDKEGYVHVTTTKINPYYRDIQNKRYITSCCGMSRQGFVFANDALTAKKIKAVRVKISAQDCFRLMNDMQQSAATFQNTGGVHNAALCDVNGIVLSRMDIGRHNALDKIYGYCLKNNISIGDKIIVFSGRISSEILLKVAKIGCEVILSKSAPTELALQLAEELGITTIGFIRNQSLNVYTHPERVVNIK
ncbi:formate dehydrogenase accessory sulfurtransferase FdhD [Bacillus pseudomycoides]|uniref:Sulfur carrier protein FdhD n=1 Tax=Bacillus pseudomycoides TaxID=64104 RepID=A0A2C4WVD4_9BACI|nr:formate dehydrogenase accessory sulfurtransferase FdhD [Bacillus pseudomycoides]PEA84314.1 formate dehydrogenase family accessory protein FdhD [Bacillus pseudomycoides]PED06439.1 formate dehydrogenase family accessory protein FdhD [Bacillus pseudomycoides]PED72439.1 formate dehydrogenase family accessory protein FdhD [Bacillus pseudomycoides]PEI41844.1 formate dehydrogenase family accessory protein FdhD [Bacillus pseudomycoides]PEI93350.1 formate dehydrogenase family accessory protein FdhD 